MAAPEERRRLGGREPHLTLSGHGGGLVIVGPGTLPAFDIADLCRYPNVQPIEASTDALSTWKIAGAEALQLSRMTSTAIRKNQLAVVYLDCLVRGDVALAPDRHEFVCARLGQIMIGLADQPVYLALHGQRLAAAIVGDGLLDGQAPVLGVVAEAAELRQLATETMFPGMAVAVVPASQDHMVLRKTLDWLESRRTQ